MTLGMMASDVEQRVDFDAMRQYKLDRVQAQLEAKDIGAVLLLDPDNIRYATSTDLSDWNRDKMVRYAIVPRGGKPVLFEIGTAGPVKQVLCPWMEPENIRPSIPWARGANARGVVDDLLKATVGGIRAALEENKVADMPIGLDVTDLYFLDALKASGLKIVNGYDVMWDARAIKCKEELQLIETAASLADGCWEFLYDQIRPGVRESYIVAEAYGWLLKNGANRISGINCVSGPRSNPHPHDWSDRMIRPEEMVFIDIMGHYMGYGSCYYRTFVTTRATQRQKDCYKRAYDMLQKSIDAVRPGVTTTDVAETWPTGIEMGYPSEAAATGVCVGHGIGLSLHEKPFISRSFAAEPTTIETGMHFALETFVGDGDDGARIESQLIVTETGHKVITRWPCEELMVCAPR